MTSVRNDKACLLFCTRLKGYFFCSKFSGNTWKNYWKFVSKTWDCTNTSVFKRLKTARDLFFFLYAEEEFLLGIMVLKRKKDKKGRKGKRKKKKKSCQGHQVCPNWTSHRPSLLMGVGVEGGFNSLPQSSWLTPRGIELGAWGSFWTVSSPRAQSM